VVVAHFLGGGHLTTNQAPLGLERNGATSNTDQTRLEATLERIGERFELLHTVKRLRAERLLMLQKVQTIEHQLAHLSPDVTRIIGELEMLPEAWP
jgi:hypothetical protein